MVGVTCIVPIISLPFDNISYLADHVQFLLSKSARAEIIAALYFISDALVEGLNPIFSNRMGLEQFELGLELAPDSPTVSVEALPFAPVPAFAVLR